VSSTDSTERTLNLPDGGNPPVADPCGWEEPCDDPAVGAMDVVVEGELPRLRRELERLRAENARLARLVDLRGHDTAPAPEQLSAAVAPPGLVVMSSPVEDKLALYTDRFRARADVYAVRWDNARTGVSGWMPAVAGGWRKGMDRKAATHLPLTGEVVSAHLVGDVFIGLYPLLTDNSCHFLVADFDGPAAMLDALAYAKAARASTVPAALEISQSGARCPRVGVLHGRCCGHGGTRRWHRPGTRGHGVARLDGPALL
jgi:hypothetical protein